MGNCKGLNPEFDNVTAYKPNTAVAKVQIIYSTVGGNTEIVVKKINQELTANDHQVELCRVDNLNPETILNYDLTILASPTYNQGTLDEHFKPFLKNWKKINLENHYFAAVGLGSMKYYSEYLTEATGLLETEIASKNAKLAVPGLRIGVDPLKVLDSLVAKWCQKIDLFLNQNFAKLI